MSRPEASLAIGRGLPGRLRACPVEPQVAGGACIAVSMIMEPLCRGGAVEAAPATRVVRVKTDAHAVGCWSSRPRITPSLTGCLARRCGITIVATFTL